MNKYSIEELMHFNRCMFLDDFIKDLKEAGLTGAWYFRSLFKKLMVENRFDILTVSQELIDNTEFSKARDKVLHDFIQRRKKPN